MSLFMVPELDLTPWPTLGPAVCDWIEDSLVYGPGDLRGEPYRLNPEQRALVFRMYEVHPEGSPRAGRRRFARVGISLRKGSAKTEFAAAIVAAELHPDAPVRCAGWRGLNPIGEGVRDPYIPLIAYTEEQSEDLAYAALYVMLAEGPLARDFDLGLERIMRRTGDGKAVALAGAPDARDGARTTHQLFDETHRFILPRQKAAHRTMLANTPKRPLADPWTLETTTAPSPGQGSVAEATFEYARSVLAAGDAGESGLLFFHREAGPEHDISTPAGLRAAIRAASGAAGEWADVERIAAQWDDPEADHSFLERVWLNRLVQGSDRAFDSKAFAECRSDRIIPDGARVTVGFDGSRTGDSTGIVVTEIETGHQAVLGVWSNPGRDDWEVPEREVDAVIEEVFARWDVWRANCDPWHWESWVSAWAGRHGDRRVVKFYTNSIRRIGAALVAYVGAIAHGEVTHDGHGELVAHIGNAVRELSNFRDSDGDRLWTIRKERPDSPFKIDLAMAAVLSWQARTEALAAGATAAAAVPRAYVFEDE
jgi:phage terminase large subunit-like protein